MFSAQAIKTQDGIRLFVEVTKKFLFIVFFRAKLTYLVSAANFITYPKKCKKIFGKTVRFKINEWAIKKRYLIIFK